MKFFEKLKSERKHLGMSQAELACLLGVSMEWVSKSERGLTTPLEITQEGALNRLQEARQKTGQNPLVSISGPVELFPTGQCMAFHNGEQVGELQKSFMDLWAENAIANGFDPEGVEIKTPRGKARITKTDFGWNFELC